MGVSAEAEYLSLLSSNVIETNKRTAEDNNDAVLPTVSSAVGRTNDRKGRS